MNKFTKDELHGILTAYEMTTEKENPSRKQVVFKATMKPKYNKHEFEN